MGLLDGLKSALGLKAEADATRAADPDDLFGMSTAYVTMEADLDYEPAGTAALCFSGVDSTDFDDAVREVDDILAAGEDETGTKARFTADDHGYEWVVLEDDDFEDLVTNIHFAADTFIERDYGSRLLAAVFAFEKADGRGGTGADGQDETDHEETADEIEAGGQDKRAYWIYSFRRGAYYPFAPRAGHERDSGAEFKLESVLDGELTVESDKEYWYPLWPDDPGGHPWE